MTAYPSNLKKAFGQERSIMRKRFYPAFLIDCVGVMQRCIFPATPTQINTWIK